MWKAVGDSTWCRLLASTDHIDKRAHMCLCVCVHTRCHYQIKGNACSRLVCSSIVLYTLWVLHPSFVLNPPSIIHQGTGGRKREVDTEWGIWGKGIWPILSDGSLQAPPAPKKAFYGNWGNWWLISELLVSLVKEFKNRFRRKLADKYIRVWEEKGRQVSTKS